MRRGLAILITIIIVIAGLVFIPWHSLQKTLDGLHVELPRYQPTAKTVWLEQNWTGKQRDWYYHANQGTLTFGIPYEWFVALEQPLIFSAGSHLSDPTYLDRYGFIASPAASDWHDLPVGFAQGGPMLKPTGQPWPNPRTKERMTGIGLTCAACHTGRFTYQNTAVIIDGGPALTNLYKLKSGIGLSLLFTRYVPFRFERFAERVLGPGASVDEKADLEAQLDEVLSQYGNAKKLEDGVEPQSILEGYARLDALNRIGNQVFSVDLNYEPKNYAGSSAPVHFPRIWDAPWFDWVQYNAAIEQPMVRNAGEALGVSAMLNLTDASRGIFSSGVQVRTLVEMEKLLAGDQPTAEKGFSGLKSPEWPKDILPPVDATLAARGAQLYTVHCQGCHLPPVNSPAFFASDAWRSKDDKGTPYEGGAKYLHVEPIPITHIGTDPAHAEDMASRKVVIPADLAALGVTSNDFGPALGQVVEKTVKYWYDSQNPPTPDADRNRMNGNRKNGIQALLAYKVRPLNGVWATPPYLHNGSVPTIYALLSPVSERPAKFWLGNREYDPVNVGYHTDKIDGGFEFDTSLRGNHNTGHEFSNEKKPGVIGPTLTPEERRALVEYIKTL